MVYGHIRVFLAKILPMLFATPISAEALSLRFRAQLVGDATIQATGLNVIHRVGPGDITFVDLEKYYPKALQSAASIILINKMTEAPPGKALLVVEDPFAVYNELALEAQPFEFLRSSIHPTAEIAPGVIIEPGVIIGPQVRVSSRVHLQSNVYLGAYTEVGENVTIQPGAIIGTDAFYYKKVAGNYLKWHSVGRVIIEDDVEIGAGCTINKGVSSETIIGKGTKLDCQVHVGHGVRIGKHTLIAAQTGIGGKSIIGDHVVIYGQVGIVQNVTIGDHAIILARSGVSKNLPGGKTYFGAPAEEVFMKNRELAILRQMASKNKK